MIADIAPAIAPSRLRDEIDALASNHCLLTSGRFRVYCARSTQIPQVLQELGRLRETTFRIVGEGTGKSTDLDEFDAYYLHLFIWDADAQAIVGAYRMGLVDEILPRYGKRGLYTQSLFHYDHRVLASLSPGIELGRSFVRVEYQCNYAPLLLLWRGIGKFVAREPRHAVLFGPVSISNSYASMSRQLMVTYLTAHTVDVDLARHVRARRPPATQKLSPAADAALSSVRNIDDLSFLVASIESDRKGIPGMLKHYLSIGGRLLGFNSDAQFAMVLDGLLMVDLRRADARMLARYMGPQEATQFLAHHFDRGAVCPTSRGGRQA